MSNYSEAIRRLRVSLDLVLNQGAGFKSLLVTSTHADEGKTTIALSLARTAAEAGLKVALLECDFRCPSLHRRLGLSHYPGLAQMLLSPGSASDANVIESDPRSACSIITSGAVADIAPDRLFQSTRFSDLLRRLEADFDLVILDSPPVGAAADSLVIAQNVDAVLLIARSGCATPHDVQVALDELTRAKNRNLVTALNFATTLSGESYGYITKVSTR
jgi:polysaccharide biosynthesis transport protein